jgi:hypothetical protein
MPFPLTAPPQATPPARLPGAGLVAQARIELSNATRSLIKALNILGNVQSDEAGAILKALDQLKRVTPDVDEGIGQSEMKSLMASAESAVPGKGAAAPGAPMGPMGMMPPSPRPMAAAGMPFNPAPPSGAAGGM